MDALLLARWQFAVTTVYHFFFVPLTLGLSLLVALMETQYVRTGDETYRRMTRFWGKLFLINFAMGVVTGIVQEFQFGMNWSEYSRYVGDIFGAPLAIEALVAFFLESTFLGIWIFGWEKLSKRLHCAAIWAVAIGSNLSAFWILVANSFMQEPKGFVLRNGRAEMENFLNLIVNPHVWLQFPHVLAGGLCTAAFFVLGISAWHLLKPQSRSLPFFQRSFRWGAVAGLIGIGAVSLVGHFQAQYLVHHQPMKMAAAEALWETENPAPLSIFSIFNEEEKRDIFSVKVPMALSFLAYNRFEGEVKGIKQLQAEAEARFGPGDYVPSVFLCYWSFRTMVGAGLAMGLVALAALFFAFKRGFKIPPLALWGTFGAILLPYVANSTGWILTEMGRQPWLVYGVLKTQDGVSTSVSVEMVATSLAIFTVLYGTLMVLDVWLLARFASKQPDALDINSAN
jgi:cytochrome d ubiquinol oxidase subunit I